MTLTDETGQGALQHQGRQRRGEPGRRRGEREADADPHRGGRGPAQRREPAGVPAQRAGRERLPGADEQAGHRAAEQRRQR